MHLNNMLHSQFIADKFQQSPALENNWPLRRSSKMSENRHHSPFSLTSRSSSFGSVEENIDALEIVTPRTYSHSPSPIPQSSADDVAEFQPWLYQLFPDTYVDDGAYLLSHPADTHYIQGGDGDSLYSGPIPRSSIGQQILNTTESDGNILSTAGTQLHPFYQ